MIRKKWIVFLWLLALPMGIPLQLGIYLAIWGRDPDFSLLSLSTWIGVVKGCVLVYQDTLFYQHYSPAMQDCILPVLLFIAAALLFSLLRWFKNPCPATLLGTILTGWVLCGLPGLLFLFMSSSNFMPRDY